jgi:hypothetical protein
MASIIGMGRSIRAAQLSESKGRTSNCPPRFAGRLSTALSTFEEERREVLASVLHSLSTEAPDPDRTAACFHLLRHLTQTGPWDGAPVSRQAG